MRDIIDACKPFLHHGAGVLNADSVQVVDDPRTYVFFENGRWIKDLDI